MNSAETETKRSVWLGFTRIGGRFEMNLESVKDGVAILGHGANELTSLMAFASHEAGLKTLVLDMNGGISDRLSGYIDEYNVSYFLYDALRIVENPRTHAQLLASAYASTLELSFEQESSLNAIAQIIANEQGVASPSSLADLIQSPDSIKGRAVDRLRVRLESLRSLNLVGPEGASKQILEKSAVLNFKDAGSPEACETAVALTISKLLALLGAEKEEKGDGVEGPDVVIVTEANRLFRSRPIFRKSQRFLTSFVSAPVPKILASDAAYGLDEDYMDTCTTRILSSAAWNEAGKGGLILTPNMFMFQNPSYGYSEVFVPRSFEPKKGEPKGVDESTVQVTTEDWKLGLRILEEIGAYEGATRASLIGFLSAEFDRDTLEKTFDRLQSEGYVGVSPEEKSGRTIHVLSLTEKGEQMIGKSKR